MKCAKGRLVAVVVIFLLAITPFSFSARFDFAPCDDYIYVKEKREVTGGLSMANAAWALRHVGDGIWMPGTWLSYQLDCTLFGVNPKAMHVHSVVVHGLNTVLLLWLLMLLMPANAKRRGLVAAGAALVWAVHPLRVESVAWIASRKDVLSMFWLLLSLIAWIWGRNRQGREAVGGYVASLAFVCIGAMCKPSVNVYPGLVFLLDWLVLGVIKVKETTGNVKAGDIPPWLIYVIPVCIGVAITIEGAWSQYAAGGFTAQHLSLYGRALNFVAAFGLYMWNTLMPLNLAVDCVQKWPTLPRGLAFGVPAILAVTWYLWREWSKLRDGGHIATPAWFLAGILWFCGALLPFMTAFGIHAQADRFTYIPSIGICFVIIGFWEWWNRYGQSRLAGRCLCGLYILVLAGLVVLSWRQTSFWQDEKTLYEHTLTVDGEDNWRAQAVLGVHSWNVDHDLDMAALRLDKARRINPSGMEDFRHIYMFVLTESGKLEEAEALLREMTDDWDRCMQQMANTGEGMARGDLPRNLRLARAAYFIATPELRPAAEEELSMIERKAPRHRLLYYLKGRLAWVNGDKESARRHWRDLLSKGEGGQYLLCPFVGSL